MRRLRLAVALVLVPGLVGCGSPASDPVMPDVMLKTLDVAKSDIKRAGFNGKVEVLGGGVFGVVDDKNWVVCEQVPLAGDAIAVEPRLEVDRSCGDDESAPSETPAAPEPSETSTAPEPSAKPSEEAPAPEPDDDEEIDLSNYKPHKLPKDSDKWTDEEWEWWLEAAVSFESDYRYAFEDAFGIEPNEAVVKVAQDFAEDVCADLDDGAKMNTIIKAIAALEEGADTQMALALAVNPGVHNFCPWHVKKLKT